MTELLVVISIVSALTVVSMTSMPSLSKAGRMTRAVTDISLVLEQARTYAMGHNTYVWVGFNEDSQRGGLAVGVTVSKNGDVADLGVSSNCLPLGRVRYFDRIELKSGGEWTRHLTSFSTPSTDLSTSTSSTGFSQRQGGSMIVFNRVMQFGPKGDSSILGALGTSRWIQIGLQQAVGGNNNDSNFAALQVAGVTGQVRALRP